MDLSVPCISISDHYPICFTRSTSKTQFKRQDHKSIPYRYYKKFCEEDFPIELSEGINSINVSQTDTDLDFANWTQNFMEVFNKHAPLKSKGLKEEPSLNG